MNVLAVWALVLAGCFAAWALVIGLIVAALP
jgi:hypothetical protein